MTKILLIIHTISDQIVEEIHIPLYLKSFKSLKRFNQSQQNLFLYYSIAQKETEKHTTFWQQIFVHMLHVLH